MLCRSGFELILESLEMSASARQGNVARFREKTNDVTPVDQTISGSISTPLPSTAFVISKTAKILVMFKTKDISARCAPKSEMSHSLPLMQ